MSLVNGCEYDDFEMTEGGDSFAMEEDPGDAYRMWQGLVGPYYLPNVDENGNISWTNNGGLENPATRNIKGPRGEQGPPGVGMQISGQVSTVSGLPASGEIGEMWAVGWSEPYTAYCWLGAWLNMGLIFPQGPQGEQGPTGITPNLQIGDVHTGAPGSPAEATITGTRDNPLLNLVLPKGDKGDAATTVANILDEETGKTYQVSQSVNVKGYLIEEFTEVTS